MNNRLKVVRAEKRITQFRLCVMTGLNTAKLSMIENGLIAPSEEERLQIAEALGVRPERIWGKSKPTKNSPPVGEERQIA